MHLLFGRRAMIAAIGFAPTAILAIPPATGLAGAARTASPHPGVALDLTAQKIWFKPALNGSVGDTTTLSAAVDSGLPVSFASADPDTCTVEGNTLTFNNVGTCRVVASQTGDGITWGPAPDVTVAIEVSNGYRAKATASHDGLVRTDGAIQGGDVLSVSVTAPGTAVKACTFMITTAGGWLMKGGGAAHPDGSCSIKTVVPMPSDAPGRAARSGREELDLCVAIASIEFVDKSKRVRATSDRTSPGGFTCRGHNRSPDEVLDFAFDGTGTPTKFSSSPNLLSWNIADWNPSYVPLQFNTEWHIAFPSWVRSCSGLYLIGDWTTVYRLENKDPGCPEWSLRLPGMLPRTMPWDGRAASWHVEIVMEYTNELGKPGQTIATQVVPYAPSDGEFRSSFPAISPTDVAKVRFVHVGDRWQPTFRISGVAESTSCHLHLHAPGAGQVADYSAAVDPATLVSSFDVPAFAKEWAYSQYFVSFSTLNTNGPSTFGAGVTALAPPTQPTIPDPIANANGTATVTADPGAGQAMSIEMSVATSMSASKVPSADRPRRHPMGARRTNKGPDKTTPAADATSLCSAVSFTSAVPRPNILSRASSTCTLRPGDYVVTARLVDGTGAVTITNRTISVVQAIPVTQSLLRPRED